jgi:hypothetical protein
MIPLPAGRGGSDRTTGSCARIQQSGACQKRPIRRRCRDLAYHDINRSRSLYYQLQRDGAVKRTARDIDIFEANTVPPSVGRYWQAG